MDRISEPQHAGQKQAWNAVEASLNYITETSAKPIYYAYEPPAGTPQIYRRIRGEDRADSKCARSG